MPVPRRALAAIGLAGTAWQGIAPAIATTSAGWSGFKARFLEPDGRVMDRGLGGVSQANWMTQALLLAVRHDDEFAFRIMRHWIVDQLQTRGDYLLPWRRLALGQGGFTPDRNNAAVADLFHAWALAEAGVRWSQPGLIREAAKTAQDILRLLVVRRHGMTLLLPAAHGFMLRDQVLLNTAHIVLPALPVLDRIAPNPAWRDLATTAAALAERAGVADSGMPNCWFRILDDGRILGFRPPGGPEPLDLLATLLFSAWSRRLSPHVIQQARAALDGSAIPGRLERPLAVPLALLREFDSLLDRVEHGRAEAHPDQPAVQERVADALMMLLVRQAWLLPTATAGLT